MTITATANRIPKTKTISPKLEYGGASFDSVLAGKLWLIFLVMVVAAVIVMFIVVVVVVVADSGGGVVIAMFV